MKLRPIAVFVLGFGIAAGAAAADPAAGRDAVTAEQDRIAAEYKADRERCGALAGNAKDVCLKEVKAAETKAKADAKAERESTEAHKDAAERSAEARKDAAETKRDADYRVAVERCDRFAGDAKDTCVRDAKARFGKS